MNLNKIAGIILFVFLFATHGHSQDQERIDLPRVIITTDANNAGGDPDDKQSLLHLFWYSTHLDIKAIIPDWWDGEGVEATMQMIDEYEKDYQNPDFNYQKKNYPTPDFFRDITKRTPESAVDKIIEEAHAKDERPLWILVWGQTKTIYDALDKDPSIVDKIRVITIATFRKLPHEDTCDAVNWNGKHNRDDLFYDKRFTNLWWLEIDWIYHAMFLGEEPKQMLEILNEYGKMGERMKEVVQPFWYARFLRVGDTPTVLYLIDPENNPDDPTQGSWAGRFTRPFPETHPNYYTGIDGGHEWDFENPCNTWDNGEKVYKARINTLLEKRDEMYQELLKYLDSLYHKNLLKEYKND